MDLSAPGEIFLREANCLISWNHMVYIHTHTNPINVFFHFFLASMMYINEYNFTPPLNHVVLYKKKYMLRNPLYIEFISFESSHQHLHQVLTSSITILNIMSPAKNLSAFPIKCNITTNTLVYVSKKTSNVVSSKWKIKVQVYLIRFDTRAVITVS